MTGIRHLYCGLILESGLAMPELPVVPATTADLVVRPAPVPASLPGAVVRTDIYEHDGRQALWRLDGVARYRVAAGGRLVEVDADPRSDPESVRLFLLHPVFALAAVLRGDWMLNAAAVAYDGAVSAFIGPSASGKSTAAAVLLRRGAGLVSDSLLRVTVDPAGRPIAHPQAPWQWLWPDSIERLEADPASGDTLRPGIALRRLRHPCVAGPLPLVRVAELCDRSGSGPAPSEPWDRPGRHPFERLLHHVAGLTWVEDLAARRTLFLWGTQVAAGAAVRRVDVPRGWPLLDRLGRRLAEWCAGGAGH